MVENSGIEWTDHTWNPWIGCQKVSPACDRCYAETLVMTRMQNMPQGRPGWGPHGARVPTAERNWQYPHRWAREARQAAARPRVFTLSLGDFFDNQANETWRSRAWSTMRDTPELDWLVLTKRPQNIAAMLPSWWGPMGLPNVWLGCTVENQAEADRRIPILLDVPARVRFLSCEPLLGIVDLTRVALPGGRYLDALSGLRYFGPGNAPVGPRVDWVIAGGETGKGARPMDPDWARSLRDQCVGSGVAFFMKQMGAPVKARQPAIPDDLLVRQFPAGAAPARGDL